MSLPSKKEINTIYIMSKGRPQCKTADTLVKLNYPGEWFIVCGNNDDKIPEYKKNWGENKVLVFDWHEEIKNTDTLDNFGFEKMPSGATPARNAIRKISEDRGELRHWQFDDDYNNFRCVDLKTNKMETIKKGASLENILFCFAKFAYKTESKNCGFATASETFNGDTAFKFRRRIFNAHNMTSKKVDWNKWRSRMNDDLINSIENWKKGNPIFSFLFASIVMPSTQSEKGGLTDIYQDEGTVRKTAYAILIEPKAVKLVKKYGRYHHKVNWDLVTPKILHEKYAK